MKVTVERAALLKSLGHVHRVVERRNTIPILSNVLIRAEAGGSACKATDLDIEVTERCAAEVSRAGATTVPAHTLYDIVRKLPDGAQVSLETTGDTGQVADPVRPLALQPAGAAARAISRISPPASCRIASRSPPAICSA